MAFVKDVKASGTNGGTFTSGAWQTRDLNTLEGDIAAVGVTLSSNQFTLPAGKYLIEARSPVNSVNQHKCKLYNVTDSVDAIIGSSEYANSTNAIAHDSKLSGVITITKSTAFELRHYCVTTKLTDGLGVTFNSAGMDEVYSEVKITRKK